MFFVFQTFNDSLSPTRLVAVSKKKSVEDIILAYQCGQRVFGENYVAELAKKAKDEVLVSKPNHVPTIQFSPLEIYAVDVWLFIVKRDVPNDFAFVFQRNACPEIKWHFIGHLQSNKVSILLKVTNLSLLETVDSRNLANSLNAYRSGMMEEYPTLSPLNVMVQVNTSEEPGKPLVFNLLKRTINLTSDSKDHSIRVFVLSAFYLFFTGKSGVNGNALTDLVQFILTECNNLKFCGLMTIGADRTGEEGQNPDFLVCLKNIIICCIFKYIFMYLQVEEHDQRLYHSFYIETLVPIFNLQMMAKLRESLCDELKLDPKSFQLSMGMSGDYEEAVSCSNCKCLIVDNSGCSFNSMQKSLSQVELGSTNVRIGSTIFGHRN